MATTTTTEPLVTSVMETTVALQQLLEDPVQAKNFLHFLKLEFGEENLSFYLEVEEFKKTQNLDIAISIITDYIKPYAEKEINISYKTKCSVANRIERLQQTHTGLQEAAQIIWGGLNVRDRSTSVFTGSMAEPDQLVDLFKEAQEEVFQLLFLGPFQRFCARETDDTNQDHVQTPEQIYNLCVDTEGWVHLHSNKKDTSKAHVFTNLQKNLFFLRASILVCNSVTSISEYLLDLNHLPEYNLEVEAATLEKSEAGMDVVKAKYKDGREDATQRFSRDVDDASIIGYQNEKHQFWIISPCDSKSTISCLYYICEFDISTDAEEYDAKAKDVLVMLRTIKANVEPHKRGFFSTRQKAATVSTVESSSSSCFPGLRRGLRPKSNSYASPPTNAFGSPEPSPPTSRPASPIPVPREANSPAPSPNPSPPHPASPLSRAQKKHFRLTFSQKA